MSGRTARVVYYPRGQFEYRLDHVLQNTALDPIPQRRYSERRT